MSNIVPIPTGRVGDYFVRQRLVNRFKVTTRDLFKLQNQISTGQRITLPSRRCAGRAAGDQPAAINGSKYPNSDKCYLEHDDFHRRSIDAEQCFRPAEQHTWRSCQRQPEFEQPAQIRQTARMPT